MPSSKYVNYTKQELIEEQENLSLATGEEIKGALGGLPVVEQTQEFFVVFDEAGSTGPEIIDKTQFRISYLVDSQLNTSKPVENTPSAFNATQNFGKSEECIVRADNATVLNQNLTGKQSIYDIGALALISTTEYGKSNDEYIQTMSFNTVGGQTVGSAQSITSKFKADVNDSNTLGSEGSLTAGFSTVITPISASTNGEDWISFNNSNTYFFQADTTLIGTRARFRSTGTVRITPLFFNNTISVTIQIILNPSNGGPEVILASAGQSFNNLDYIPQTRTWSFLVQSPFRNFFQNDEVFVRVIRNDITGNVNSSTNVSFNLIDFGSSQETPAGDILIMGVNACTASYWSGFETVGDSTDDTQNYSILTASQDFSIFTDGQHIQKMNITSSGFDPENDGNIFNPIQTPLTFESGDEIRFEYNKNKVHKVIRSEESDVGRKVFIHPAIDTVELNVLGSNGTQLNHFTHYRIVPNGGYLIINQKKDNQAGVDQNFKGIITPQSPSPILKRKGDELIFELKKAGIIET